MTLAAQALRSTAMIHASSNFAHMVASEKLDSHRLVTTGVYAFVAPFCFWFAESSKLRAGIAFLQLDAAPGLHRILLLGTGHSARSAEPGIIRYLRCRLVAVFLLPNQR